jgi:eukaryotic-like serine/threonine-protein kinase
VPVLASGARLGPYEIVASLGAGGMGEVYRARDTRLNRDVAVKVLPENTAADSSAVARFKREAEAVAALHHPNICVLHDIGRESSTDFIVMEHLEGESLADRLERGSLSLDEALRIGIEVARGLGAAHRAGIVHRDLKPGNIMVTSAGAKLVDFGLAQLKPHAGTVVVSAMTQTRPATAPGTILGTLPYMAPEQIEGHAADARTDVFALGAVIYEMVTGKRAFPANSGPSLIASILEHQPPQITEALPSAPPLLQRVVAKCLAKRPDDRWQAAEDVAETLEWVRGNEGVGQRGRRAPTIAWIAAAAAAVVAIAALTLLAMRPRALRDPLRLSVVAPPGTSFHPIDISGSPQFALSPDGTRIAFVAGTATQQRLWIRRLDAPAAQALDGTEDASIPFWSPDSTTVAFFARGRLKKVRVEGGAGVQDLAAASIDVNGGTWNRDGVILFGAGPGDGLFRVSAEGGTAVPETTLDAARKEVGHRWPQFLPDGRRYLLYVRSYVPGAGGVYVGVLGSPDRRMLLETATNAVFVMPDKLLFNQSGTLTAQTLDVDAGRLVGSPQSLPDQITTLTGPGQLPLSASVTGRVAYWYGDRVWSALSWFDRSGGQLTLGLPDGLTDSPEISSDGTRLLFSHGARGGTSARSIWVQELGTAVHTRLTLAPSIGRFAVLSPDSTAAALSSFTPTGYRLSRRLLTGTGEDETIVDSDIHWAMMPTSWRGDNLVYQVTVTKSGWDLGMVRLSSGQAAPLVSAAGHQVQGQLSPDSRWVAYSSNESGTWEVLVETVPPGGKWQISTGGGTQPRWRGDAKELFYVAADGTMIAAPLRVVGPSLAIAGPLQRLFQTRMPAMLAPYRVGYAVAPDGQRFVVSTVAPDSPPQVITIIDNLR